MQRILPGQRALPGYYWLLEDLPKVIEGAVEPPDLGWRLCEIDQAGDIFSPPGEQLRLVRIDSGTYILAPLKAGPGIFPKEARQRLPIPEPPADKVPAGAQRIEPAGEDDQVDPVSVPTTS